MDDFTSNSSVDICPISAAEGRDHEFHDIGGVGRASPLSAPISELA